MMTRGNDFYSFMITSNMGRSFTYHWHVCDLAAGKENFIFTDVGDLEAYLGVEVTKHANKTIELCQPFLIDKIIKTIAGDANNLHSSNIPAAKELLHKDEGDQREHEFNYCQGIRMLTYLQGTSRLDIAMPVHQLARFSANPKGSHKKAVMKVCLLSQRDQGKRYHSLFKHISWYCMLCGCKFRIWMVS